ncbi:hypothetical protein HLB44_12405 [Aquincola sp. S2]|uniref:Phytase-like domain-containing protein n=1 Tax=Pseudaquabacterium terrae TaxID=2732868 RepID=A0ABX2EGT6_9BURK|nr:hypothetical protein [Aquabacterium terrae]NRF67786.1 hypothetical protein [Aquabacterium terrae]
MLGAAALRIGRRMTFGPRLANGNHSLAIVADDNFPTADSATDRNQVLVFEVLR